jgi:hypothetical protein
LRDFLISLIGGGFVGAGAVAVLFKLFIKNQLEKSQREFQHHLDGKKLQLEAELSVFAESKKEHSVSYQQKKVSALERCYSAVVNTSLPRHQFRKKPTISRFSGTPEEQNASRYFHLFSENFQAFSRAFDSVSNGYAKLEDVGLYMDSILEKKVTATLQKINDFYMRKHAEMGQAHEQATAHFDGKSIENGSITFDFEAFHYSMLREWNLETKLLRQELKDELRAVLQPS